MKNMIQLSNLDLHNFSNLLSCKVLHDTTMKFLCLGKCFQVSIKEKSGLNQDGDLPEQLTPSTFKEETDFIDEENMLILKHHFMTCYWQLRKIFLDYLEDSMSQDSFIGSKISTRSRKNISCACRISSPSVLSQDTKTSRVSKKSNSHDFYPKNFNHAFLPKTDFEEYMSNAMKDYEEDQDYFTTDGCQGNQIILEQEND